MSTRTLLLRNAMLAALVLCAPRDVALAVIDGRIVVRGGRLLTIDLPVVLERHRNLARALARGER